MHVMARRTAPRAEVHATLDMVEDRELWRQVETVATLYTANRPHLREEFESACNLAVARAYINWRPGRGATLRTFATFSAHRACRRVLVECRVRGYKNEPVGPRIRSLDTSITDDGFRLLDDLTAAGPEGDGADLDTRAKVAEVLAAAGEDAEYVWLFYGVGLTFKEIGARVGRSAQRAQQRARRGMGRIMEVMGADAQRGRDTSDESATVSVR
jgi:DNA-directed RNA polymerase specialized sigma24 family protein